MVTARVRERRGIAIRKPLRLRRPQLSSRARTLGEERPGEREHRPEVDPGELRPVFGMAREFGIEHRLGERPRESAPVG